MVSKGTMIVIVLRVYYTEFISIFFLLIKDFLKQATAMFVTLQTTSASEQRVMFFYSQTFIIWTSIVGNKLTMRWFIFANALANAFFFKLFSFCYSFSHPRFFFCAPFY